MDRPALEEPAPGKPSNGDVGLGSPHQLTDMDNPLQIPGQHQPHGRLRDNARPPIDRAVGLAHLPVQPGQTQYPVDPPQDVVVGHQVTERTGNESVVRAGVSWCAARGDNPDFGNVAGVRVQAPRRGT